MRQVVLDTETTGLEPTQGHRIIEIGCVEVVNRRLTGNHYHVYLNPRREVDEGAVEVHGLTTEFLQDKPEFHQVVDEFMGFVSGAELVIHNAPFDIAFIDSELALLNDGRGKLLDYCTVVDSLLIARQKHPGQRNSLDALCQRYGVDNSQRELHGALLDAEILADVYLAMTGGQTALALSAGETDSRPGSMSGGEPIRRLPADRPALQVIRASDSELEAHHERVAAIDKAAEAGAVWLKEESVGGS